LERPSKKWQGARRAALERARSAAIEPLVPLYTIYAVVCVCYLAGFLRFQFFDSTTEFTLFAAVQIVIVAIAGALVPFLTGSVLTLHFANLKLRRLAAD